MELFKEEDGKVVLDLSIKQIPEFKRLIERDKDRFKKQAQMDLLYVYFTCDYKSPYVKNTPESERKSRVKKELRIPSGWEPDADIIFAQERYKNLQRTATVDTLASVREALLTSNKLLNVLRKQIDEGLSDEAALAQNPAMIVQLTESLNAILVLGQKIPTTVKTIAELETKVKEEQASTKVRQKGGGESGAYEQ